MYLVWFEHNLFIMSGIHANSESLCVVSITWMQHTEVNVTAMYIDKNRSHCNYYINNLHCMIFRLLLSLPNTCTNYKSLFMIIIMIVCVETCKWENNYMYIHIVLLILISCVWCVLNVRTEINMDRKWIMNVVCEKPWRVIVQHLQMRKCDFGWIQKLQKRKNHAYFDGWFLFNYKELEKSTIWQN